MNCKKVSGKVKKPITFASLATLASLALIGCGAVDSAKDKTVNMEIGVYGGKVTASDITSNGSPSFQFGFGSIDYHSTLAKAGQSFKARRTTWSIWGDRKSSETVVELGELKEDGVVAVKSIPAGVVDISAQGAKTDTMAVSVP
jgi:hypothetical protein